MCIALLQQYICNINILTSVKCIHFHLNIDSCPQDHLGLKQMNEEGRLIFLSVNGNHLQFSEDWFVNTILRGYLQ